MARARTSGGHEGLQTAHVKDTTKIVCDYCGGTQFHISNLMDDPNDIADDTTFAALLLTIGGGSFQGLVASCKHCGHEKIPLWYCIDVAASNGTTLTMTNLDQATTANLMAGLYLIPCVGTDVGKYFIVSTNTAAAPTVITPTVAPNADCDGIWIITNILPLGLTVAS